jgi:hypothetical protein
MPRIAPITGKSDVPAEHHHVLDAVVTVLGNVRSLAILTAVREREAADVWAAQVGATRRAGGREEGYVAMLSGIVSACEVPAPAGGDPLPA